MWSPLSTAPSGSSTLYTNSGIAICAGALGVTPLGGVAVNTALTSSGLSC